MSEVGLTKAKELLYDPNAIELIVADPKPEDTIAETVPVDPPTVRFNTAGLVVTWHGVNVGMGV